MKNYFLLFLVAGFIAISCSTDSIECDLVGEWVYERETFNSFSTFEDPDTRGIMVFNEDETGTWITNDGFEFGQDIEWDLQSNDSQIAITRKFSSEFQFPGNTQIYTINQSDQKNFTLKFELRIDDFLDSLNNSFVQFENIILTRK